MEVSLPPWIETKRSLLLDSNLLVVLVIGKSDEAFLGSKPIQHFELSDYERLRHFIGAFNSIVTTPYILAEVSNLLNKSQAGELCRRTLAGMISAIDEVHAAATELADDPNFARFGIADVSIIHAANDDTLVLTNDEPLLGLLTKSNVSVLRYRDISA